MTDKKKSAKVPGLKEKASDDLNVHKNVSGHKKAPGQVGLAAPHTLDAIRKPKSEQRMDTGKRDFGGVSAPQVSDQTYDLYNTPKKSNKKK